MFLLYKVLEAMSSASNRTVNCECSLLYVACEHPCLCYHGSIDLEIILEPAQRNKEDPSTIAVVGFATFTLCID